MPVYRKISSNSAYPCTANAALVKAEADVEAAKLALEEYLSGSYREKEEQLESTEFVAKENLRRAEEYLEQ